MGRLWGLEVAYSKIYQKTVYASEIPQNLSKIDSNILEQKRITLISLNFYPEDTAIGLYSSQMANYLREQGAEVTVITAFPYYPHWVIAESYKNKPRYVKEMYNGMTVLP